MRAFLATSPVDPRRGFDGLSALTFEILKQDPLSGHLFVFRNRRSERLTVLFFSRAGQRLRPAGKVNLDVGAIPAVRNRFTTIVSSLRMAA